MARCALQLYMARMMLVAQPVNSCLAVGGILFASNVAACHCYCKLLEFLFIAEVCKSGLPSCWVSSFGRRIVVKTQVHTHNYSEARLAEYCSY